MKHLRDFLAVSLGLLLCAPVYSEPQTIDELPGYNVISKFADLQWESTAEQVRASLEKKGYKFTEKTSLLKEDGRTPVNPENFHLNFGKDLFGEEARVSCGFEASKLVTVHVSFYEIGLSKAWGFTQKVRRVLLAKYGEPAFSMSLIPDETAALKKRQGTIADASNFAKEQKNLKELYATLQWVGPYHPVFTRRSLPLNVTLELSLNRGVVRLRYSSTQSNKTRAERIQKIWDREDKERAEREKRHKKDAEDF